LRAAMRRGGGNTLATWNRAVALTFKGGLLTTKVNMDKEHVKGAAQQSAGDIKNARRKAADSTSVDTEPGVSSFDWTQRS
jgi:hypothetical protein